MIFIIIDHLAIDVAVFQEVFPGTIIVVNVTTATVIIIRSRFLDLRLLRSRY